MTDNNLLATLCLERLDDAELLECDLLAALGLWEDSGRDVQEVWDEEGKDLNTILVALTCTVSKEYRR
jgi:hypothetical protein